MAQPIVTVTVTVTMHVIMHDARDSDACHISLPVAGLSWNCAKDLDALGRQFEPYFTAFTPVTCRRAGDNICFSILIVKTTLFRTVHTKLARSYARKGTWGAKGATGRLRTIELGNNTSQATTPNQAQRGALTGAGSRRGRVTPTVTIPGRCSRTAAGRVLRGAAQEPSAEAGRTCSKGISGAGTRHRGAARGRRRK